MKRFFWMMSVSMLIACSGGEKEEEKSTAAADWQASFDELMKEHQDFMKNYNEKVASHDEWMTKHEARGDSNFVVLKEQHTSLLMKHEDFIETFAFDIKAHEDLKAAYDAGEKDDQALEADLTVIQTQIKTLKDAKGGMLTSVEAIATEHMQMTASNENDGFEDDL